MGTSTETVDRTVRQWQRRGWTTIVLEEHEDGRWRATQEGVACEGVGETAALAAAAYCRRVEGRDE